MPRSENSASPNHLRLVSKRGGRSGLSRVRRVPFVSAVAEDSIVRAELAAGRVGLEALRTAWQHRQASDDSRPLWRILADVQGTDAAALFRAAAEKAGYRGVSVSVTDTSRFLASAHGILALGTRRRMLELGVFPAVEDASSGSSAASCYAGSFEPQKAEVRAIAAKAGMRPRYVDPAVLAELVDECAGADFLQSLWWYRSFVRGDRPIGLYKSTEFARHRRAA